MVIDGVDFTGIQVELKRWSTCLIFRSSDTYRGIIVVQTGNNANIDIVDLIRTRAFTVQAIDSYHVLIKTTQEGLTTDINLLYL